MTPTTNLETLLSFVESGGRPKYVFFWGHRQRGGNIDKACFSQWFPAPFMVDTRYYPTAEHWMMAEKARLFNDQEILEQIFNASSPGAAKALGRKVRGFKPDIWDAHKFEIVVRGNIEKFRQNPAMGQFLLSTGQRVLVEASPVDKIWGIGIAQDHGDVANPRMWKGENLLGFALMEARDALVSAP